MAVIEITPPPIGEAPDGLTRYLYRMVEELNYALRNVGDGSANGSGSDAGQTLNISNAMAVQMGSLSRSEFEAFKTWAESTAADIRQAAQQIRTDTEVLVQEESDRLTAMVASEYISQATQVDDDMSEYSQTVRDLIASMLEQTASAITSTFVTETQLQVAIAEGIDVAVLRSETYIRQSADGIEIGKSDEPYSVVLSNDQLKFKNGNAVVAYISGNKLYITSAHITQDLQLGKFIARVLPDYGIAIKWVG